MARKHKRRTDKLAPLPGVELVGPTPEQLSRDTYTRETITHADDFQRAVVHINRGGTPVMRWATDGKLSDSQQRAIAHCLYLWRLCGLEQRTTSSYGERILTTGDSEARASCEIEAREDLHRIQDYIPAKYWATFENVVRFDEPAGVAGSKLGFGERSGADRAHTIVCFVADIIADRERL